VLRVSSVSGTHQASSIDQSSCGHMKEWGCLNALMNVKNGRIGMRLEIVSFPESSMSIVY